MSTGPSKIRAVRSLLLIAACAVASMAFRPGSVGLRLAVHDSGVSLLLKASFVKVAFDFGQACSESDTCRGLLR